MRSAIRWFWSLLLLWLAGVLQQSLSQRMAIFGVPPDFLLVAMGAMALLTHRTKATSFGFLAGLIQGALSGANMAHYIVSRSVSAFAMATVSRSGLQIGLLLAGVLCAGMTVLAQFLLLFLAPPRDILSFIGATIGTAVYNGVLAMPLYALLRRFAEPQTA